MKDEERALLQKRIRLQRRELKRLNRNVFRLSEKAKQCERQQAYRNAAEVVSSFTFASSAAKVLRRWAWQ